MDDFYKFGTFGFIISRKKALVKRFLKLYVLFTIGLSKSACSGMYRNRIGVAGVDPVSKPLEKTMRFTD